MKPLHPNQVEAYRLVQSMTAGTKYAPKGKWMNYNTLDYILKTSNDAAYYGLPSQANQQTLKLLMRDYKSFFEALKAYQAAPERFTGCPHLPGYAKRMKTAVLTNQICKIKDNRLKMPGIKTKLNLGTIRKDALLKEVRICPDGDDFVINVVLSVPKEGIAPAEDETFLADLASMENLSGLRVLSIDPGLDNLAAVTNNFGNDPLLIKGQWIKSMNQWYNKELARLKSSAELCNGRKTTKRIRILTAKRNRRIKDAFHKISRMIANYAKENKADLVILGHNEFQKQEINIGHVNNQSFVQIPFFVFAGMLRYKLNAYGIHFICTEEAYTSKADYLAEDPLPVYKEGRKYTFSGKRIERGLYKHYDGTISNADVNGSANIMRKVFPKVRQ